jgi:hypothetical protein
MILRCFGLVHTRTPRSSGVKDSSALVSVQMPIFQTFARSSRVPAPPGPCRGLCRPDRAFVLADEIGRWARPAQAAALRTALRLERSRDGAQGRTGFGTFLSQSDLPRRSASTGICELTGCCVCRMGRRCQPTSSSITSSARRDARTSGRTASIGCGITATRSVRIWRCVGARSCDSGIGRTSGPDDDASGTCTESGGDRRRDPNAGTAESCFCAWRHSGDSGCVIRYLHSAVRFSWRGRRDSNPWLRLFGAQGVHRRDR